MSDAPPTEASEPIPPIGDEAPRDAPTAPSSHAEGVDPEEGRRRRINTASLAIIATILSVGAFTYLRTVVQPVLVAIFLFFMIRPAADWLVRRGLREWVAWLTLFGLVVILSVVATQIVYGQAVAFADRRDEVINRMARNVARLTGQPEEDIREFAFTRLFDLSFEEAFSYTFGFAASFLEVALMVFFYLMFVIIDARDVPGRVRRAFAANTAEHLVHVGRSIADGITEYVRIKTLVSLGMGATAGVVMWAFRVPYWELWAFLTFLFNYVTYIGSLLIIVPPVVVTFALSETNPMAVVALLLLLCVNRVAWIDYVEIRYAGKSLNINSVLILMSLAYWGTFWGVLGLILAVPMLTCAKIVLANFENTKKWATLMTED